MKTPKERAEEKRREKLALIEDQVARGELTVRKMTAKERKENPPRERSAEKRPRR